MPIETIARPSIQPVGPPPAPRAVPDGELTNHEYDGIREYDNPTPGWWHMLFLASIVFSVFYFTYYTFSPDAQTIQDSWASMQTAEYARIFGALGTLENDDQTVHKLMADPKMMQVAAGIFVGNCAACHARDGGGINGVNLTDDAYKNVKVIVDVFNVITDGANSGAMPSWRNKLTKNERVLMAAYAASLRGTTPVAPKGPEGSPIPEWPKP
jgi:cytochrome c oxidase cbb3-type subunit 3